MLKIIYVTDALMLGGVETQLVDLILRLDRSRFEPFVVCLYGPRARDNYFQKPLTQAGVPVYMLDRMWGATDKLQIINDLRGIFHSIQPDIIQPENYHSNLLARLAKFGFGKAKFIGTQRTVYTQKQLRYEKWGSRFADTIVVSAEHLKTQLTQHVDIPAQKIQIIHNAIDVQRFAHPQKILARTDILPKNSRMLLSLGRISRQKRMDLICDALHTLQSQSKPNPNWNILIVGPIQDEDSQRALMEKRAKYHLEDYITILPGTDTPEAYYAACDATILFSTDESYPCVMMESLAAGKPLIISEEANAAMVVEHKKTGWAVPTHNIATFAESIADFYAISDTELAEMKTAACQRGQFFGIDRLVQEYERLYQNLKNS